MAEQLGRKTTKLLQTAHRMELETVANDLANSIYLNGVDAVEIKCALASDAPEDSLTSCR